MSDIECRVAKLEQRLDGLCRELTEDKEDSKELMKDISEKLNAIIATQSKQKGFWSGVVFVISAVAGSFGMITYFFTGKAP
ncbi:MAG: hypothetical protein ACXV8O_01480 [Methylobacter sp.]